MLRSLVLLRRINMQELYRVGGTLNEGFVGQISYTICLDREYKNLDIHFAYDKHHYFDITEEIIAKVQRQCCAYYGVAEYSREDAIDQIQHQLKTEIQTLATLNDEFIGGVHSRAHDRHMLYINNEASEGCIPQESFSGVLKVTILVYSVLMDDTHYTLSVSAE